MAVLLILESIFEADFMECSQGVRPKRRGAVINLSVSVFASKMEQIRSTTCNLRHFRVSSLS